MPSDFSNIEKSLFKGKIYVSNQWSEDSLYKFNQYISEHYKEYLEIVDPAKEIFIAHLFNNLQREEGISLTAEHDGATYIC